MVQPHNLITAVIDINVFISGTSVSSQAYPGQIINLWQNNYFKLAISEPILTRMSEVYKYPKVKQLTKIFDDTEIDELIYYIRKTATIITTLPRINISPDPEDNSLFSCAIGANADYIVSGDKKHVLSIQNYKGIQILSPKDFVDEIKILNN